MSCKDHNGNTCEINKGICIGEEECEKAKLLQEIKELKKENDGLKSQLDFEIQRRAVAENATELLEDEYCELVRNYKELQQENAELKEEVKQLHNCRNPEELYTLFGKPIKYWEELRAENERLKEENGELCDRMATVTYRATGGRLSYSNYTLDAIEQAFYDQLDILSDKKIEPYKQTLQEIKETAETAINGGYATKSSDYSEGMEIIGHYVLQKITKAEEE